MKIDDKGTVKDAGPASNTGLPPGVATCATDVLRRTTFTAPKGESAVNVPLTFTIQK